MPRYAVHHFSGHQNEHIAFWLVAHVHKLDTHVKWSARWHARRDDAGPESSDWLFRDYMCDAMVLHEFIRRGLVTSIEKDVTEHVFDEAWIRLQDMDREPSGNVWFEVVVDAFTEDVVKFSFSLRATKYHVADLALPKQLYYLFADRIGAKVRFVHEWFALEAVSTRLEDALRRGKVLPPVAAALRHELSLLRTPTEAQIQASCRSLFPLLEGAMRAYMEAGSSGKRAGTLDDLIRRFESAKVVSTETIELLRFIMKPKRDYVEHGRHLPAPLAKLVLATLLDIMSRLGDVDVEPDSNRP